MPGAAPPRFPASAFTATRRFMKDPFDLLYDAHRQCGDIFTIRLLGLGDWTFLCTPAMLEAMYAAPHEVLNAGEVNHEIQGFILGDDATFCFEGEKHHERQRLVLRNLSGKRVLQHTELIRRATDKMLDGWTLGESFSLLEATHHLALEILTELILGVDDEDRVRELVELFDDFAVHGARSSAVMMKFLRVNLGKWSPWGKVLHYKGRLTDAFRVEIERQIARSPEDLDGDMGFLARLIVESREAGKPLGTDSLLDEAVNIIFAGHETTSLGLTWGMERLINNPHVLERARAEIAEVVGERPVEPEDVRKLEYLTAVLHETLRWRPFAPMASVRRVKKPFDVEGRTVAPGGVVTQAFPVMTRREETFPDPERFDPERFYRKKMPRYTWMPFGGGRHACLGKGLAEVEIPIILATLIQRADLRLDQESVSIERAGHFFAPSRGLRVVLERRL